MPYTSDSKIFPVLRRLKDCLCEGLAAAGLDEGQCKCVLLHGDGTVLGQPAIGETIAWVGLGTIFPSKAFPTPDSSGSNCGAPLAAQVVVGVVRCYDFEMGGEDEDDLLLYMDMQMADMAAMEKAILCCARAGDAPVQLGGYTPIGPEGGTYGGIWTLTIGQED